MIGSPFLMLSLTISSVSGEVELKLFSLKETASFLITLTMRVSDHHSCCSYKSPHSRDSLFRPSELGDSKVLKKIPSAVLGRNWWLRTGKHWRQGSLWRRERYFSAGKIFQNFVQRSVRAELFRFKTRKIFSSSCLAETQILNIPD